MKGQMNRSENREGTDEVMPHRGTESVLVLLFVGLQDGSPSAVSAGSRKPQLSTEPKNRALGGSTYRWGSDTDSGRVRATFSPTPAPIAAYF